MYSRAQSPEDGPETIKVFDYIEWDQEIIEKTLVEETGWQKPDRSLSWRYDCVLEPLLDYTYQREFGISSAGLYLCDLIRSGGISREEALAHRRERGAIAAGRKPEDRSGFPGDPRRHIKRSSSHVQRNDAA